MVTGAGSGLGRAIAVELAGRGFVVLATDIDPDAAAETAEAIGVGTTSMVLDVRDAEACRAAAAAAISRSGSLDLWVNNAGVLITGNAWEQDEVARQTMVEVNAVGTMNGTVAALERMTAVGQRPRDQRRLAGRLGRRARRGRLLGEQARGDGLHPRHPLRPATGRVSARSSSSAVCPDGIWTPMLEGKLDDPDAAGSFSGRLLTPEQVATAIGRLTERPTAGAGPAPLARAAAAPLRPLSPAGDATAAAGDEGRRRRQQRRYKSLIESGKWPK